MDALRLIKTARHALAEARTVPDALLEAWQAGLLTEAIGSRIADRDIGEIGALGQVLSDAGSHAAGCLEPPPDDAGGSVVGRVDRLGELGELEPVLRELGSLLDETGEALVVLACGADTESLYWRCIDGVDAGAECKDLVAELLRTVRQENGEPSPERGCDDGTGAEGLGPDDPVSADPVSADPVPVDSVPDDLLPDEQVVDRRSSEVPEPGVPSKGRAEETPVLVVTLSPPSGRKRAQLSVGPALSSSLR